MGDPLASPSVFVLDGYFTIAELDFGSAAFTGGTRHQIASMLQKTAHPQPRLDLLVITHIDRDHLEGVLGLLEQDSPGFTAKGVWFNAFYHLPEDPAEISFSPMQAERLTTRLAGVQWGWNQDFGGGALNE